MGLQIYEKGSFVPDMGDLHRCYPIGTEPKINEIVYDKRIQSMSYIQANVVGVFNDWITSFFPNSYFKSFRIKTQSSYADFKSWMKGIYKKEKPIMVINPSSIEVVEDSLFGSNMLNRYNFIDPEHDNVGAKLVYSRPIMKDERFELVYRRNRYRFEMEIMIMEQTLDRQLNTYNMMLMNIRHNSKFMLPRMLPHMIPIRYIQHIAYMHNMDWQSEEYLKYLNSISEYPIIKRYTGNGQPMFFFEQQMNIQVEVPNFPSRDTPEMSEAIEWGARIVDSFTLIADLPSEFIYLVPKEYMTKIDRGFDEDPDDIYITSPVYADLDWPEEVNGYRITNKVDIMLQEGDPTKLHIVPMLREYSQELYEFVNNFIRNGQPLGDIMIVRVYPNGSYTETGSTLSDDGILELLNPKMNKIYTACIYIDFGKMNLIKDAHNKEYVGTIEKY